MPVYKTTQQLFWEDHTVSARFRTGVSLHSHTMYSEESLAIMSDFVSRFPVLRQAFDSSVDYERSFWTPPLTPRHSYRLEEKQIQHRFQLPALVSLTDHDDIQAGQLLSVLERFSSCPISTEWSIPFGSTFFHLGVHNLPRAQAVELMAEMRRYTAAPNPYLLRQLLETLHSSPDVLMVLNHPLWDEQGIGNAGHEETLSGLIQRYGQYIHALEVNGLRSFSENQRVLRYGAQIGLPVVAGGDRHGCEPNAIVNLTAGATFGEFIEEVRDRHASHVVFMPQYRRSLALRTALTVHDILREYPTGPHERRVWSQRVFFRKEVNASPMPFSSLPQSFTARATFGALNAVLRGVQSLPARLATQAILGEKTGQTPYRNRQVPASLENESETVA